MASSAFSYRLLRLASKPTAQMTYSFNPATSANSAGWPLLVFLNGLGLPQAGWVSVIQKLWERRPGQCPAILTYDRFGQGQTTDRDPADEGAEDPKHGHDVMSVVTDLRQLITQIAADELGVTNVDALPLVLVGNSIGCAIARLYVQTYRGTVAGLVLLDSVIANTDFVSIFPDPDAPDFAQNSVLPDGVTPDHLRDTRAAMMRIFHPDNGSAEGLSRRNLRDLLPHSDRPPLEGPHGRGPYLTVVGHDFETFADQSTRMGVPATTTVNYSNPYWQAYNEGLAKLTEAERSKGPVRAPNAGHFVQQDNPDFVVQEVDELLNRVIR